MRKIDKETILQVKKEISSWSADETAMLVSSLFMDLITLKKFVITAFLFGAITGAGAISIALILKGLI